MQVELRKIAQHDNGARSGVSCVGKLHWRHFLSPVTLSLASKHLLSHLTCCSALSLYVAQGGDSSSITAGPTVLDDFQLKGGRRGIPETSLFPNVVMQLKDRKRV